MALTALLVVCWELSLVVLVAGSLTAPGPDHLMWGRAGAALTAVVAVVSGPLMVRWAQPAFTALLASHWDNAQGVLTDVGQSLRRLPPDAADLDGLVTGIAEQVARRLRLPYVAIVVDDEAVGTGGRPADAAPLVEVPLSFAGEPVGTLVAAPRGRERALSVDDRALLDELAVHIGMTLHAARATRDLQDSRAALITAREEERRRIRRDLHDGLGPTLASLRFHLAAVEALIGSDPDRATELVGRLRTEVAGTAGQVRALVYGLRPPMLDELGLAEALRSQVAGVSGLTLTVEGAEPTGTLPAAVEVALYRIASEAVSNVVRHAGASRCQVILTPVTDAADVGGRGVRLQVVDDGRGLPQPLVPGVGLAAIRERAEELGGQMELGSGPAGTTVTVVLPGAGEAP